MLLSAERAWEELAKTLETAAAHTGFLLGLGQTKF
jgi:hypothetical protein